MVSQVKESTSVNIVLSEDMHIPGSSQLEVHGRLTGIATISGGSRYFTATIGAYSHSCGEALYG